jgi:hypothetical protein
MDDRAEGIERRFEIPILVAALLVIPVIAIEQSSLDEPWPIIAAIANWLIWGAFARSGSASLVQGLPRVPARASPR